MTGPLKAAITAVVLSGAALPILAGDGHWTAEGLQGRYSVYSLAIGQPPRTLFAGTWQGVLRSTETGIWTGILAEDYTDIAVDPSNSNTVYAGGFSGVFKSTDGGDHFTMISPDGVTCIAIDPAAPSTLYVGKGYSWDESTAYAGAVHKSTDGGVSWSALATTSLADGIASLVLDPRRPGTVYAGTDVYYDYPGYPPRPLSEHRAVIGTVDGGAEWIGMLGSSEAPAGILGVALAVEPDSGTVFGGASTLDSSASVFRGSFGAPWTRVEVGLGLKVSGINALVIDTSNPRTMYAGTISAGVFRSVDAGVTWTPMNDGLFDDGKLGYSGLLIHSLVLDPTDGVLRAGTENGVFAIRPGVPSAPCTPGPRHLCLLGGRYRATVMAQIPDWQATQGLQVARGAIVQQGERFGSFSFPKFTGDASFPEVFVKMVDPGGDRGAWVFHGSLTHLPYVLSITDTATGRMETYTNQAENRFCGGVDVSAFYEEPDPWDYLRVSDPAPPGPLEGWMPDSHAGALALLGGRFSIALTAHSTRHGRTDPGVAVANSDRHGYFSLPGFTGDSAFAEVVVKMIDRSAASGSFRLFYSGLTNLDYTLTVTDTVTGVVRTYESPGDFCGSVVTILDLS